MKVLFLRDVKGTARAGEVKEVADGFARNYLLPKGIAVTASAGALKNVNFQKQISSEKENRQQRENETLAGKLEATSVTFKVRVGEQYRLYGSITSQDIAEEVENAIKQPVDKHKVLLAEPIRHLGTFKVPIKVGGLTPEVTVRVEDETGTAPTPDAGAAPAQ